MYDSCIYKQTKVKEIFSTCTSAESRYNKIIELGRSLPKVKPENKVPQNIVKGCQSIVYMVSSFENGKITFEAESDALISSGLAALLILVYSGETPETILKCPPAFLEELGISASLTPSRANGLFSILLRMKQDALYYLTKSSRQ